MKTVAGWMVSDKGATKFAESLCSHPALAALLLCNHTLWRNSREAGRDISDVGAERMGETMKVCTQLRRVYVWGSDITERGAKKFFEHVKTNRWIEVLQIGSKKLSRTFCDNFMKYAKEQNSQSELIMVCNDYEEFNGSFVSRELAPMETRGDVTIQE